MLDEVHALVQEIGKLPGKYLVSCFFMNGEWRIDYYAPKEHKMYTYFREGKKVKVQKDAIFQKEEKPLEALQLDTVKVHYLEALEKVSVHADKFIVILQVLDGRTVWNITALTPEFKVYNLRVDAVSGEVISEGEESVMNFKKGGPEFKMENSSS